MVRGPPGAVPEPTSVGDKPLPCRILIVDDSPFARRVLREVLQGSGHEVLEAVDGQQALAIVEGHAVDLVIADVHMPAMDGLALVRRLRAHPEHRLVPIALLTAVTAPEREGWPREVEADAWLTKALDAAAVRTTVRRLLRR